MRFADWVFSSAHLIQAAVSRQRLNFSPTCLCACLFLLDVQSRPLHRCGTQSDYKTHWPDPLDFARLLLIPYETSHTGRSTVGPFFFFCDLGPLLPFTSWFFSVLTATHPAIGRMNFRAHSDSEYLDCATRSLLSTLPDSERGNRFNGPFLLLPDEVTLLF